MKPTPNARPSWSRLTLILAGPALLFWGCGHTREILYPGRKVAPPRSAKTRLPRTKLEPIDPILKESSPAPNPQRQPDGPTAIDVPIINRHDR